MSHTTIASTTSPAAAPRAIVGACPAESWNPGVEGEDAAGGSIPAMISSGAALSGCETEPTKASPGTLGGCSRGGEAEGIGCSGSSTAAPGFAVPADVPGSAGGADGSRSGSAIALSPAKARPAAALTCWLSSLAASEDSAPRAAIATPLFGESSSSSNSDTTPARTHGRRSSRLSRNSEGRSEATGRGFVPRNNRPST